MANWYAELSAWKQARIGAIGEIAINLDDLKQSIETILKTYPGEDCLRDFGSRLRDQIDKPLNIAKPLIIRDVVEAIAKWEPRVELISQDVTSTVQGQLFLTIHWKVAGTELSAQSLITLGSLVKH